MTRLTLEEILSLEDHNELLDVKPSAPGVASDATRVTQDFEELNNFIDQYGFIPGEGPENHKPSVKERVLSARLKSYRQNLEIASQVKHVDRHNLIDAETLPEPLSLDDILDLEDDLLSTPNDIFTLRHTRPSAAQPDKVSERKPCKDFEKFKPLFDACVSDIVSGKRKSIKFANEQEINAGEFFILNGIMVYVAEVNDPHIRNGKRNARLRLIFENGTEGENLQRSLATQLYKDPSGRRISAPEVGPLFDPVPLTKTIAAPEERITGSLYIVRSLSAHPEITRLEGQLFKVGFTTGNVEDRLRGAKDDPTFLFAPVHLLRSYDAIKMNTAKFESLMHRFFASVRLDIELADRFNRAYRPQEWFLVPLPIIEQAIKMLLDGSIVGHQYDRVTGKIVRVSL